VSAAIGGEYSPREGLASLSPRGMTPRGLFSAQSPRLMNLKNMSFVKQVAVDPHASTYAFWEKHVQLTNMRQSFAASRGFSRDGSATISRPASAQFGHLSPRMRTRKPGRVLDVPSGLPSGFGPLELWGTVPEGEFGQPLQHGSASPASPTRKPPTTSAAPKLFALPQGISLEELQSAHDQIKEKLLSKYGSFTRAFRSIDQDGTGFIERHEFERALRTVNLDGIRQPVVLCLLEMMDYDDDDDGEAGYDIKYEEFVQFLAADDVRTLFPNSDKRDHKLGYKKAVKAVEKKAPVKRLYDPHVTAAELLQAHTMIKEQIQMKHGYFGKAFKYMDADRTGFVDRNEFKLAIKLMSLDTHIRPPVIDALFNLIERDGDHFKSGKGSDEIQYRDFAKYMSSETLNEVTTDAKIKEAMAAANAANRDEVNAYNEALLQPPSIDAPAIAPGAISKAPPPPDKIKLSPRQRAKVRAGIDTPLSAMLSARTSQRPRSGQASGKAGTADEWRKLKRSAEAAMKDGPQAAMKEDGGYLKAKAASFEELLAGSDVLPEGVTAKQLLRTLKQIGQKFKDKYNRMSTAFKNMDKDRSGHLDRSEIAFVLREDFNLNLSDNEMDAIINLMDVDKSGSIEYTEFARVVTAGDIETTWQERLARSTKDFTDYSGQYVKA